MKTILLRHDSDIWVYSVPDMVADNLRECCNEDYFNYSIANNGSH